MKENYVCINNDVIINDITNCGVNVIKRTYQDNIGRILKIENIIEVLEDKKKNYEISIKQKENRINGKIKKNISIIVASIVTGLFVYIISFLINPFSITNVLLGTLTTFGSFSLLSSTFINNLKNIKSLKKEINGLNLASLALEVQKEEVQNLLVKLEKDNTRNKSSYEQNKIKKVHYLDELNEIKKTLWLYTSIGANEKEFRKYYKEGTLDFKLADSFSEQERTEIKVYLKRKK